MGYASAAPALLFSAMIEENLSFSLFSFFSHPTFREVEGNLYCFSRTLTLMEGRDDGDDCSLVKV